jgi:hypothetical protein
VVERQRRQNLRKWRLLRVRLPVNTRYGDSHPFESDLLHQDPIKKATSSVKQLTEKLEDATGTATGLGACTCGKGMVTIYSKSKDKADELGEGFIASERSYVQGANKNGGGFMASFGSTVFGLPAHSVAEL